MRAELAWAQVFNDIEARQWFTRRQDERREMQPHNNALLRQPPITSVQTGSSAFPLITFDKWGSVVNFGFMYFDAHNHFQDDLLKPHREQLLEELPRLGVQGMVVNGTCVADWPVVEALAQRASWITPSFGLHPWDAGNRSGDWLGELRRFLVATPHAAVGEIGIDKWILERAKPDDPRLTGLRRAPMAEQFDVFHAQLDLACELGRTASIHCIDAWGLLLDELRSRPLPAQGFLLHAYAGPAEMLPAFANLGAYFSFNGSFVDPRKTKVREAFRLMPALRLLVETDAPAMLPPLPWRHHALPDADGTQINHPANIRTSYEGLAQIRGISTEQLAAICQTNFSKLFGSRN